jgi:N-acylneuraminate cytidylyltransferase
VNDKLPALQQLAKDRGLSAREIAYLGNDTNDLGPLSWVGLPCVVADVHPDVLPTLQRPGTLMLSKLGGYGAVRELCDMLRAARS